MAIYFQKYKDFNDQGKYHSANSFRLKALTLMRKHSADDELDPVAVVDMIPEDWEMETENYDMNNFLKSVFDH